MNETRTTSVFRKTILSVWESILAQRGIPISPFCIRTTTNKHGESGQLVYARALPVRSLFEFVTLKEGTVGSYAASNRSGRPMELYATGSGLISILKNAKKRSYTLRRESSSRTWEAGRLHRLEYAITGRWNCTKLPGLIRRREFRRSRSFSLTCIPTTAKGSRKPLIK